MEELKKKYHRYLIILSNRLSCNEEIKKDLYQEGLLGLWEAKQLYNESKGTFHSFAIMRMKGRMLKWLTKYSRIIHIPANQLNETRRTVDNLPSTISSNTPSNEDGGTIEDLLGYEDEDKSLDDGEKELRDRLRYCFSQLKPAYQDIITMRNIEGMTFLEISEEMKISQQGAQAKYKLAIHKLKSYMLNLVKKC